MSGISEGQIPTLDQRNGFHQGLSSVIRFPMPARNVRKEACGLITDLIIVANVVVRVARTTHLSGMGCVALSDKAVE